tara:strand:- start:208 stop:921 length:714 start_codon:yes stop_codon:yes gene_type:complete
MTMGRRLLPALAAIVCLLAGPALAELSAGERAYITGDFAAARQAFEAAAKDGDPEAQTRLAVLYLRGEGVNKNPETAAGLLRTAAKAGYPPAIMNLAKMYYHGIGVPRDKALAADWYGKAAAMEEPVAMHSLAILNLKGDGIPQDIERGVALTRRAAEIGFLDSMYQLGQFYENGLGVEKDLTQAYYWYFIATQRRFLPAEGAMHAVGERLDPETTMDIERRASAFEPKSRKLPAKQ